MVTLSPSPDSHKRCKSCGEVKPHDQFSPHKASKGGRLARCKACVSIARQATYRGRDHASKREYDRVRYAANADAVKARRRARYSENGAGEREASRAYVAAHPEQMAAYRAAWRARELGASLVDLSAADWAETREYFGDRCAYCNRHLRHPQQDHIVPLSRGGAHVQDNVVPACFECNRSKSDWPLMLWLAKDTFEQAGLPGFAVTPFGGQV